MHDTVVIAFIASVLLQIGLSIFGWSRIPSGKQVAIHWGWDLKQDGFAPKPVALLAMPAFTILLGSALAAMDLATSALNVITFAITLIGHAVIVLVAVK